MPLLDQNQKINAALIDRARNIASHIAAANGQTNAIVSDLLALDDAALSDWLNSQGGAEIYALFEAHAVLGSRLNDSAETAATVLESSGINAPTTRADVRAFSEKLSEAGREMTVDENGVMTITTNPQ